MVRIVSDTGPIIGLAKIEKLDLLKILGEEIIIPPWQESHQLVLEIYRATASFLKTETYGLVNQLKR